MSKAAPILEAHGSGPIDVCMWAHTHVQMWSHGLQGGKRISGHLRFLLSISLLLTKSPLHRKDWENLGHEFWGPRLWGTVGWCEGESVFTLAHKTSMGPHKMQPHITLRGWDP